jgi:mRNA interferase MazF
MTSTLTPKRGEVWLVNFAPAVGAEIRKVRPSVVLTASGVGRLPLEIVVPLTDWKPNHANWSWFVAIPATPTNGLSKDSGADTFQVKSLSRDRFVRRLGTVSPRQVDDIATAVANCVDAP